MFFLPVTFCNRDRGHSRQIAALVESSSCLSASRKTGQAVLPSGKQVIKYLSSLAGAQEGMTQGFENEPEGQGFQIVMFSRGHFNSSFLPRTSKFVLRQGGCFEVGSFFTWETKRQQRHPLVGPDFDTYQIAWVCPLVG